MHSGNSSLCQPHSLHCDALPSQASGCVCLEVAPLHAVSQATSSAGPSRHHLETIASQLVEEFPDVFVLAKRLLTPDYNSGMAAEGPEPLGQDLVVPVAQFQVSKHSCRDGESGIAGVSHVGTGQWSHHGMLLCLQEMLATKQLLYQYADIFQHALARQQIGVSKADADAALADSKIPLMLGDAEAAEMLSASGQNCLTVFVAPQDIQVGAQY